MAGDGHERLVVRGLSVVDSEGTERIALGVQEQGESTAYVHLLHPSGKPAALLETDKDGGSKLVLFDSIGYWRASLAIGDDGTAQLLLADHKNGIPRITLNITPDYPGGWPGSAEIQINGPDGTIRALLSVSNEEGVQYCSPIRNGEPLR